MEKKIEIKGIESSYFCSKAGYQGNDAMREKAIREFGYEFKRLNQGYDNPPSFSAKTRTPLRQYKKGGHVKNEK